MTSLRPMAEADSRTMEMIIARMTLCRDEGVQHLTRSLTEVWLSLRLEVELTADQRKAIYFNLLYFGESQYGISDAADHYFAKPVAELSLADVALLDALSRRTAAVSPTRHPDRALMGRNKTLDRWKSLGVISTEQALSAEREPLPAVGSTQR